MRLNVHDYSGHTFQVQLSRYLAERGHTVLHGYSSQYITGHGRLTVGPGDPVTLRIEPITTSVPMIKYSPLGRTRFEIRYAAAWQRSLEREAFDVVVACNVPLFALARMQTYFTRRNQPWVLWHQDIYSHGVAGEARLRFSPLVADAVAAAVERVERRQIGGADAVVAIDDAFLRQYRQWGVTPQHAVVIPNWAPLDDLVPGERDNAWSRRHDIPTEATRLLYAGTLGRKHNPRLLLEVLDRTRARGLDAVLTVISHGTGASDLAEAAAGRPDVRVLDFQPAELMSDVLASADVHLTLLEPSAAHFSVPSKVLSSLSAGRPVIGLMPGTNPAAVDIRAAGGFIAEPSLAGADEASCWLARASADPIALKRLGVQAREFAAARFDIRRIGLEFEAILNHAAGRHATTGPLVVRSGSLNGSICGEARE